ncbi:MAG: tRNA (N(6)-L-threonylcarbamoyladenosine(37)-C(2))-methylthiotransferase MtaB [Bacteroidaceae bacterium]|nr:tRNA (N(6)-L-threonylcarbamoyladenosine(37)-C(2))-methylthiotransferase MtaB [Bacteroidaceae bacterium]
MIDNTIFKDKKAAYFTLGCKLNFAETSSISRLLEQNGFRKVRAGEKADICIINTCSVTELADKKSRQTIRKISRQHPGAFVVVTGCYAQLKPDTVAHIDDVDLVLGAEHKMDILNYLGNLTKKADGNIVSSKSSEIKTFAPSCSQDDRTRHFLKVQDGCDYFCSYCTIPFARGRSRNGAIESLVSQAREVAEKGGKEIVLTGVNIGDFGKSTGETFFDLVKALDTVEGIERYRISSIEPNLLTDEIIEYVAGSKRFAPHFHVPLQSGSDDVLRLMKRRYDTQLFRHKMETIKKFIPDAFIGIDLIVGVRGETDKFFNDAYKFVSSLPVSQLHVFTYSERPNTQALKIDYIVSPEEKHNRCKQMLALSEQKLKQFYFSQKGKIREVLFEQPRKGMPMHGFTDNYIRVELPAIPELINTIGKVKLSDIYNKAGDALCVERITQ